MRRTCPIREYARKQGELKRKREQFREKLRKEKIKRK